MTVFSSNCALYADMSWQGMSRLEQEAVKAAVYSIDEAFLRLTDLPPHELGDLGRRIRKTVRRPTGILVRFGIGPTKTLAKLCNHLAKGEPDGVVVFPGGGKRGRCWSRSRSARCGASAASTRSSCANTGSPRRGA
ncbi:MAG: hypothetical protein GVY12_11790 [Bacteroidetes bacterium]|nr:hypothetical protein [Bacteroidota bacterium]